MDPRQIGCKCDECPLAKDGIPQYTPVGGAGPKGARLMLVGEGPGLDETRTKKPFTGPSGQMLNLTLQSVGLKREEAYVTNAIMCSPPGSDKPPAKAYKCCEPRLRREIKEVSPDVVVTLGAVAAKKVLSTNKSMGDIVGAAFEKDGHIVIPTYHPAAVLRGAYGFFDDIEDTFKRVRGILVEGDTVDHHDTEMDFHHIRDDHHAARALRELLEKANAAAREGKILDWSMDTETDSVRYLAHDLLQIGIFDGEEAWCFEYSGRVRLESGEYLPEKKRPWPAPVRRLFLDLLQHPAIRWWFHNQAFDLQFLWHNFGVMPPNTADTMCLALGTTEQGERVGLKRLARRWFNAPDYDAALDEWLHKNKKKRRFSSIPRTVLAKYLALDVYYTWKLIPILERECRREGTLDLAYNTLMPFARLFAKQEYTGVLVDKEYIGKLEKKWRSVIEEAREELRVMADVYDFDAGEVVKKPKDRRLNPASPKQLMHLLFDKMGLYPLGGRRSTDKEFCEHYKDHPFIKKLIHFRTVSKMMSTYITGIDKVAWPEDNRCHPDILLFGTRTGRLAIKRPPLQTIPKEGRLRMQFDSLRKLFTVPEGYYFVHVDYSQLEYRIAWHYSQDENLGKSLMQEDFHRATAAKIFQIPYEEVTAAQRHASKFVSFGILYGRQAFSLAKGELAELTGGNVEIAQQYIDQFFAEHPDLHRWWLNTIETAVEQQWLQTPTGRKRRWSLIMPGNIKEVRNQAVNFPIQSLASDLCCHAATRIDPIFRERGWGETLFNVHDAICAQVKKEYLHEAMAVMEEVMCDPPFETCAVFEVDREYGPNWGELQDYDPQTSA